MVSLSHVQHGDNQTSSLKSKKTMKTTLIFIHGMFQNAKSWDHWVTYFTEQGYHCIAESWPLHEGEPSDLRSTPPTNLGDLRLEEIINKYAKLVEETDPKAILIGHSVGGLIVQSLLNKGLGSAGVCVASVAPNKMLAFDWSFFKNSISIANPFKGDEPFFMTAEGFHGSFANTMSKEDSDMAYELTATHDSRNVLRDCMMEAGHIDLEKTDKPMLFIGGEKDQIIPYELNEKNAKAYKEGLAQFAKFDNKGHFICNEPGWLALLDYVSAWMTAYKQPEYADNSVHSLKK
jgi:pimeloyl-ACP methyl ester carboxylesterase